MSRQRCENAATALLPWLLNGTLEGAEAEEVRRHVQECAICSEEIGLLARIGRAVEENGVSLPAPGGARRGATGSARTGWAVAAGLAVPAALGIGWAILGFPLKDDGTAPAPGTLTAPRHAPALRPGVVLGLGGGAARDDAATEKFVVPEGADVVAITFTVPVDPDARYVVELRGPDGRLLGSREGVLAMDRMARSTISVAAPEMRTPGDYLLTVRERHEGREERVFEYPFRVEAGSALRQE